jgi:WXG100 family type VII secretion target
MAAKISITTAQMEMRIGEVKRAREDFEMIFTNMNAMATGLREEWHGQASESFFYQFQDIKGQALEPMKDLLDRLRTQMEQTLQAIRDLDQQLAGKFNA